MKLMQNLRHEISPQARSIKQWISKLDDWRYACGSEAVTPQLIFFVISCIFHLKLLVWQYTFTFYGLYTYVKQAMYWMGDLISGLHLYVPYITDRTCYVKSKKHNFDKNLYIYTMYNTQTNRQTSTLSKLVYYLRFYVHFFHRIVSNRKLYLWF